MGRGVHGMLHSTPPTRNLEDLWGFFCLFHNLRHYKSCDILDMGGIVHWGGVGLHRVKRKESFGVGNVFTSLSMPVDGIAVISGSVG